MPITKEEAKAIVLIFKAVADTIMELKEVPSGVLYSQLMDRLSLQQYTSIIETLKRTGLVKESGHLLTWVEPTP